MAAYYNEIDPYAAQWLRNLIVAWHIAPGEVDERSIADVRADDIRGFTQCHFFAGIGIWSHALRLAGWDDSREVWTGSCPCQPFSTAGKGEGYSDERHLWPHWNRLIAECRPPVIFGEQVDAAIRTGWLDDVSLSLEQLGYAIGSVSFPACSVGAPHIRQRFYFVADAEHTRHGRPPANASQQGGDWKGNRLSDGGGNGLCTTAGELADTKEWRRRTRRISEECDGSEAPEWSSDEQQPSRLRDAGLSLGDADDKGPQGYRRPFAEHGSQGRQGEKRHGATAGFWSDADWLPCIDGKARPTKPGTFPLAHGYPSRVGILRAAGNAIVAPQAAEFVRAYMECQP